VLLMLHDLLARLSSSLSSIEQYAVRHPSYHTTSVLHKQLIICALHTIWMPFQDLLARLSSPIKQYMVRHLQTRRFTWAYLWIQQLFHNMMHRQPLTSAAGSMFNFQDLLARLSSSLSPIEQYAVRHLEAQRPVDVEAAAAAAVEDIQKEEWDLDAIEKRKEQQVRQSGFTVLATLLFLQLIIVRMRLGAWLNECVVVLRMVCHL
jgi:hypothetical protein